jgi:hypothetical protein
MNSNFALNGETSSGAKGKAYCGEVLKYASGRRRKQPRTERLPGVSGSERAGD